MPSRQKQVPPSREARHLYSQDKDSQSLEAIKTSGVKAITRVAVTYSTPPSRRRRLCSLAFHRTVCRDLCTVFQRDTRTLCPDMRSLLEEIISMQSLSGRTYCNLFRLSCQCSRSARRTAIEQECRWHWSTGTVPRDKGGNRSFVRPNCHLRHSRSNDHTSWSRRCIWNRWHNEIHSIDKKFHLLMRDIRLASITIVAFDWGNEKEKKRLIHKY